MRWLRSLVFVGSFVSMALIGSNETQKASQPPITEGEVHAAQKAWCDGLVSIGQAYRDGKDYHAVANRLLDDLYDYAEGRVFFKPTLAHGRNTFRPTREGALSYFIDDNPKFPEDTGFALKEWKQVTYDNNADENGIQIYGNIAIAMGHVFLTDGSGDITTVEKTFVFRRCRDGKLRLCVHNSALPYQPK